MRIYRLFNNLRGVFLRFFAWVIGTTVESYVLYTCPACGEEQHCANALRHVRTVHETHWLLSPTSTWVRLTDACVRAELDELMKNSNGEFVFVVDIIQERL